MNTADFLAEDDVLLDYAASSKTQVLQGLSKIAARRLNLKPVPIVTALLKREQLGSTGIGGGVALPHAGVTGVDRSFGILARLKDPIDFEAIDGNPVDIVFLLLAPPASSTDQLAVLASVARALKNPQILVQLRNAERIDAMYRTVTWHS